MTDISAQRQAYLDKAGVGDLAGCTEMITRLLERHPENGLLWNDAGAAFFNMGLAEEAVVCFEKAIGTGFAGPEVRDNLQTALKSLDCGRQSINKVAVFCGGDGDTFFRDIAAHLGKKYELRFFNGSSEEDIRQLMEWSDVSWFEWCTNLAVIGSRLPKCCTSIVRLHRYEAYVGWVQKMNWATVDHLITVGNPVVEQYVKRLVPGIEHQVRMHVIPNGVDVERFGFVERAKGKNIAFVANLRDVKNPALAIQCAAALCEKDPGYRLFIAGKGGEPVLEQYIGHVISQPGLRGKIIYDGWQNDINGWLEDKHYILCTSMIESQGMGVLEAMARGIRPVVHNYPGAADVFSREYVFTTVNQFCEQVLCGNYKPYEYRNFVEQRYSLAGQLGRIDELFSGIARKKFQTAGRCLG